MSEHWIDTNKMAEHTGECQAAIAVGKNHLGVCRETVTAIVHHTTTGKIKHCCGLHAQILLHLKGWQLESKGSER